MILASLISIMLVVVYYLCSLSFRVPCCWSFQAFYTKLEKIKYFSNIRRLDQAYPINFNYFCIRFYLTKQEPTCKFFEINNILSKIKCSLGYLLSAGMSGFFCQKNNLKVMVQPITTQLQSKPYCRTFAFWFSFP